MKKVFVSLLMMSLAVSAMAIELPRPGFGVQVGWAEPVLRLNSPTSKDSLANTVKLHGFKVGLTYDVSYVAGFGSTLGLNYTFGMSNSGWKSMYSINEYPKTRTTITYHQVELYVDWQYKFEVAKETYLMLYTGPSIQCGLNFTMRTDTKREDPLTGEVSTTYGDRYDAYNADKQEEGSAPGYNQADNALKRLNITWGIGAGFQYKRYYIRGGYDFGLINPYKNRDFVNGNHTRGRLDQWSIRLGVYIWYPDL